MHISIGVQTFLKKRSQVNKMGCEAQVFLCELELHHEWSMRHSAKERVKRFSRLEIDRPVLYLDRDIFSECSVQRLEFNVCLFETVIRSFITIYKCSPHDNSAMRCQRIRQHISAIRMCSAIVLRSRLSF